MSLTVSLVWSWLLLGLEISVAELSESRLVTEHGFNEEGYLREEATEPSEAWELSEDCSPASSVSVRGELIAEHT